MPKFKINNEHEKEFEAHECEEGTCPNCKNEELEYDSCYPEGNQMIYPFTCRKCGCQGKEFYAMNFNGMNITV